MTPSADQPKYWAFISYSHADSKWGKWLHKQLETFPVPRALVGKKTERGYDVPKRLMPIFRDREELPGSATLKDNIQEALEQSRYLVVICSPRSAASIWVNEEVLTFKAMGRSDRVLCLIVDGEPNATDKPGCGLLECFPPAVRHAVNPDRSLSQQREEPIAADARPGKDGKTDALLKLASGLLGVGFDELKRREDARRRFRRIVWTATLATLVMVAFWAAIQFQEQRLRLQAEAESLASFREADKQFQDSQASGHLGLAHLIKSLKRNPRNTAAASRLFTELSDKNWVLPDKPLATGKGVPSVVAFSKYGRFVAMAFTSDSGKPDAESNLALVHLEGGTSQRDIPFKHGEIQQLEFINDEYLLIRFRGISVPDFFGFELYSLTANKVVYRSANFRSLINTIALSDDGRLLAVAGGSLGDNARDNKKMTFDDEPDRANSPDATGWIKVFQIEENNPSLLFDHHFDMPILTARFSHQNRFLAAAGGHVPSEARDPLADKIDPAFETSGAVWLFDTNSGELIGKPLRQNGYVSSCDISEDGQHIATGSALGVARVWRLSGDGSAELVAMVRDEDVGELGVTLIRNGTSLLTWGFSGNVRQWTTFDGAPETVILNHGTYFSRARLSDDWLTRISWGGVLPIYKGGLLRILEPEGSLPLIQPLRWPQDSIVDVWISDTSDRLKVFRSSLTEKSWAVNEVSLIPRRAISDQHLLNRGTDFITSSSLDGRWVLAVDNPTRTLRLFDTASRSFQHTTKLDQQTEAITFGQGKTAALKLIMPDGSQKVAFYSLDPLVCTSETVALDLNADGVIIGEEHAASLAAVYGQLKPRSRNTDAKHRFLIHIYDVRSAKRKLTIECPSRVLSVSLSPNGTMIAASCEGGPDSNKSTVYVWDSKGRQLTELPHSGGARVVGFSADGSRLATIDLNAHLWEVPSFRLVADLLSHSRAVTVVSFAKNGRELATASLDGSVQRWDTQTGTPLGERIQGEGPVNSVLYNAAGDRLLVSWFASPSYSTTSSRLFDTQTGLQLSSEKFTRFADNGISAFFTADDRSIGLPTGQWRWPIEGSAKDSESAAYVEYWDIGFGNGAVPDWLLTLAESLTSYRIGDDGSIMDRANASDVEEALQSIDEIRSYLGSTSDNSTFSGLGKWLLSSDKGRTISPYSKTTISEHRKRLIEELGQQRHLMEARQLDPSDTLTWAKLANITSKPFAERWWELIMKRQPMDPQILDLRADYLFANDDLTGAETLLRKSLMYRENVSGSLSPDSLNSLGTLAFLLDYMGETAEAEALYRRALAGKEKILGPEHPETLTTMRNLASLLHSKGDYAGAEPLYADWMAFYRKAPSNLEELSRNMALLGHARLMLGRYLEAEQTLSECLAIRREQTPSDWRYYNTQSMLGEALLKQKKLSEAEPFVAEAAKELLSLKDTVPEEACPRVVEAVNRARSLYKKAGNQAQASYWSAELEKLKNDPRYTLLE